MRNAVIRLAICSPYLVAADTLKSVFSHQPDIAVVGATITPADALRYAIESDIFLVHAAFPRPVVLDLCRVISRSSTARAIVFGTPPDAAGLLRLIESGARGYVPRGRPFCTWLEVLRAVASDGASIEPELTWALLKRHRELRQRIARHA